MKPLRSRSHLDFIRSLPCVIPGCKRKAEAAHIGPRGLSQKADYNRTVPLCAHHHREQHQLGRRRFEAHYGVDLNAVIERLTQRPKMSIRSGYFIAELNGDEYMAGPISIGPQKAAKRAIDFFRECYRDSLLEQTKRNEGSSGFVKTV